MICCMVSYEPSAYLSAALKPKIRFNKKNLNDSLLSYRQRQVKELANTWRVVGDFGSVEKKFLRQNAAV